MGFADLDSASPPETAGPRSWIAVEGVRVSFVLQGDEEETGLISERHGCPVLQIGASGLSFESATTLKVGDVLSVAVHLPERRNFVIATAEVTEMVPTAHARRIACTFTDVPPPLRQRIRRVMRDHAAKSEGAQAGASARQITALRDRARNLTGKLNVNQEVFIDVLELYAMGVNLDEITRSSEAESSAEAETGSGRRLPVYELDEWGALPITDEQRPSGEPAEDLLLPVTQGGESFGCRCTHRLDAFPEKILNAGDVLIFSDEESPRDADVVLRPAGARAVLGKVYEFLGGAVLVFQPAGPGEPPIVLDCPVAAAGYRLVARYERL
jgi:hypothetical protein